MKHAGKLYHGEHLVKPDEAPFEKLVRRAQSVFSSQSPQMDEIVLVAG